MIKYLLPAAVAFSLFADEIPSPQIRRQRPILEEKKTSRTFFTGEFLYWVPQMDGLNYVQERVAPPSGGGYKLEPKEIKGTYEPGFRVNAGHIFDEKGLDILMPYKVGNLATPRLFEIAAAVNRLRSLQIKPK